MRDGILEQITTDHSLVAELVRTGVLTPEEAERHPQRSAITRAVGTERAIDADVFTVARRARRPVPASAPTGCTDMLSEAEIAAAIVGAEADPTRAAEALVAAANEQGGEDNITVVLFELVEGEPGSRAEPEPRAGMQGPRRDRADGAGRRPVEETCRRHGAGPGGRAAAIGFIALVVVVGLLALYWGISR